MSCWFDSECMLWGYCSQSLSPPACTLHDPDKHSSHHYTFWACFSFWHMQCTQPPNQVFLQHIGEPSFSTYSFDWTRVGCGLTYLLHWRMQAGRVMIIMWRDLATHTCDWFTTTLMFHVVLSYAGLGRVFKLHLVHVHFQYWDTTANQSPETAPSILQTMTGLTSCTGWCLKYELHIPPWSQRVHGCVNNGIHLKNIFRRSALWTNNTHVSTPSLFQPLSPQGILGWSNLRIERSTGTATAWCQSNGKITQQQNAVVGVRGTTVTSYPCQPACCEQQVVSDLV